MFVVRIEYIPCRIFVFDLQYLVNSSAEPVKVEFKLFEHVPSGVVEKVFIRKSFFDFS